MSIEARDSGTDKTVQGLWAREGGVDKEVQEVVVNDAGTDKTVFTAGPTIIDDFEDGDTNVKGFTGWTVESGVTLTASSSSVISGTYSGRKESSAGQSGSPAISVTGMGKVFKLNFDFQFESDGGVTRHTFEFPSANGTDFVNISFQDDGDILLRTRSIGFTLLSVQWSSSNNYHFEITFDYANGSVTFLIEENGNSFVNQTEPEDFSQTGDTDGFRIGVNPLNDSTDSITLLDNVEAEL